MDSERRRVSTVHLGQFTRETANEIAGELEEADIVWWYKEPGWLSSVWEFGVRLFVDRARLAEAKAIAERIVAERQARREEYERESHEADPQGEPDPGS